MPVRYSTRSRAANKAKRSARAPRRVATPRAATRRPARSR